MKTYVRPVRWSWWTRNPYYLRYMLREASCVVLTVYALILLTGLYRLQQGKVFFDAWRESLASPLSIAFHALALALVLYHSWTWFRIMPKTLPFVRVGGWRVPDQAIVVSGVLGVVFCSAAILAWLRT